MATVEYFCLVTVKFPVEGRIREQAREVKLSLSPDSDDTQTLWRYAKEEAKQQVRHNYDVDLDKIEATGFTFYPMILPYR